MKIGRMSSLINKLSKIRLEDINAQFDNAESIVNVGRISELTFKQPVVIENRRKTQNGIV
jgi:hypothetical protein